MNSLPANLICSQQALEKRQNHSVLSARSQSLLRASYSIYMCHLFIILPTSSGLWNVLLWTTCYVLSAAWESGCGEGSPRCWSPSHTTLSLPVCLPAPVACKGHSCRDNNHVIGTWDVPNKHFLKEHAIEIVICCISLWVKSTELSYSLLSLQQPLLLFI